MFANVVIGRRCMQSALGVKHILSPGFVETDTHIVIVAVQFSETSMSELPRAKETRATRRRQLVAGQFTRKGGGVPLARVEMNIVAVGDKAARQVSDVGLAAAASRVHIFIAQGDVHE